MHQLLTFIIFPSILLQASGMTSVCFCRSIDCRGLNGDTDRLRVWFYTISDRHKIIKLIILVYSIILSPSRRTRPELVSSYSHRRRIWGFFIIYCRSLSAFSSIEVYLTAISRTDLCTRHSTVQYSTVHRIQYNRFGKQRLLRMTLSLLKLPCASLTPDPVSYTHTHTRPATEPSATRRHVSCHVISGQPRPRLRS